MVTLHIKCIHCKYEEWIPLSEWTTICPKCGQHGVYMIESHPHPPRMVTDNGKNNNSKG